MKFCGEAPPPTRAIYPPTSRDGHWSSCLDGFFCRTCLVCIHCYCLASWDAVGSDTGLRCCACEGAVWQGPLAAWALPRPTTLPPLESRSW